MVMSTYYIHHEAYILEFIERLRCAASAHPEVRTYKSTTWRYIPHTTAKEYLDQKVTLPCRRPAFVRARVRPTTFARVRPRATERVRGVHIHIHDRPTAVERCAINHHRAQNRA